MTHKLLKGTLAGFTLCGLIICLSIAPQFSVGAQPLPILTVPASTTSSASKSNASHKGMVWVNPRTKIFHRPGDRWYGKTKGGKYMPEADALKAGYRPAKPRHQLSKAKKATK